MALRLVHGKFFAEGFGSAFAARSGGTHAGKLYAMQRRFLATAASRRLIAQVRARLGPTAPGRPPVPPPEPAVIADAVGAIAKQRNGYLAWSVYVAL